MNSLVDHLRDRLAFYGWACQHTVEILTSQAFMQADDSAVVVDRWVRLEDSRVCLWYLKQVWPEVAGFTWLGQPSAFPWRDDFRRIVRRP